MKDDIKKLASAMISALEWDKENNGLGSGRMGIAYARMYFGQCFDDPYQKQLSLTLLEEIFNDLTRPNYRITDMSLLDGLVGILSATADLVNHDLLDFELEYFAEMDKLVYEHALNQITENNIDFLYGPMGALSYFLSRSCNKKVAVYAAQIGEQVCERLVSPGAQGYLLNNSYNLRDKRSEKEINYTMAHGMTAVWLNLLQLYKHNGDQKLGSAIKESINLFIKENEGRSSNRVCQRFFNAQNREEKKAFYVGRLGWCSGDLNILQVLYTGAKILDEPAWSQLANSEAVNIVSRLDYTSSLVNDPFLCHGYLGVSHYYSLLNSISQNPIFYSASQSWLKKGLEHFKPVSSGDFTIPTAKSFLYGNTGALLSLISAYQPSLSHWSKIILL